MNSVYKQQQADTPHSSSNKLLRPELAAWMAIQGLALAATVVTSLFLSGCANTGDATTHAQALDPQRVATAHLRGSVSNRVWPQEQWWAEFGDARLNNLVTEALAGNPTGRIAQARLERAQALARVAESSATPDLHASGALTREKFTANYIYPPPLGGATWAVDQAGVNFSWDLDFWGKHKAAIESAHAQAKASEADAAAARLALSTSVVHAWFQLQRQFDLRANTEAILAQREDLLKLTAQRVNAGIDTRAELHQAEVGIPATRADLVQIDESIALTRNQLAALLGQGPDAGAALGADVRPAGTIGNGLGLPLTLPADLIARRPDIVAARWRVESAAHDIDAAKAQFYPNIDLVASASLISIGNSRFLRAASQDESIGPAISLPIFTGSLRANLRGKAADYDTAVEQYNQTLLDAFRDVADQIVSLRALAAQQAEQNQVMKHDQEILALARERYQAGLGNRLAVLNAENAVLAQRHTDVELRARALELNVALVRALGGGYHAGNLPGSGDIASATASTKDNARVIMPGTAQITQQ